MNRQRLRIAVGKLGEIGGATPRKPIVNASFRPQPPTKSKTAQLLVAGVSSVSLWILTKDLLEDQGSAAESRSHDENVDPLQAVSPLGSMELERESPTGTPKTGGSQAAAEEPMKHWLHAKACTKPPCHAQMLQSWSDHVPSYVANVAWAPTGDMFASADSSQILLYKTVKDNPNYFVRCESIVDAGVGEVFEIAWLSPSVLAVGGIGVIRFVRVNPETGLREDTPSSVRALQLPEGAFCRGLCSRLSAYTGELLLGVATSTSFCGLYSCTDAGMALLTEKWSCPAVKDVPVLRIPAIDPTGRFVGFPFCERNGQFFAQVLDVSEILRGRKMADAESTTVLRDAEYRVRGHHSRISSVAFGNCLRPCGLSPSCFLEKLGENHLVRRFVEENEDLITRQDRWPTAIRYAQASVDGCVSVWEMYISTNQAPVSGQCLFAFPTSVVDQTSLITSLSWSADDSMLVIASDDGKVTVIVMDDNTDERPVLWHSNEKWVTKAGADQSPTVRDKSLPRVGSP